MANQCTAAWVLKNHEHLQFTTPPLLISFLAMISPPAANSDDVFGNKPVFYTEIPFEA
jgi:hypothetical protein